MKILLCAAFTEEIMITLDYLEENWEKESFFEYSKDGVHIFTLITGAGSLNAGFALSRHNEIKEIKYLINPGIGAALSRTLDLSRVYIIESDGFGDIGLEESDGTFQDQHDLNWVKKDSFPYNKSRITPKKFINPTFLPKCTGLTLNKIPGTLHNIEYLERKYHYDMITLDAGAIMYACRMFDMESISYRVATRYVEPWQKETGDIEKALVQLNMRTIDLLKSFIAEKKAASKIDDSNQLSSLFD